MGTTILLIDDVKEILEEVDSILTMEGYKVLTATNGYEAAQLLESYKIDLVVTDLMMKEMNGFEMISFVKTVNNHLPIIVLSGDTNNANIKKALRLEADIFLKKPCSTDDLLLAVQRLIS